MTPILFRAPRRIKALAIIFVAFVILTGCKSLTESNLSDAVGTPDPGITWALSGYLPTAPDQKVWITIQGANIAAINSAAPGGVQFTIDTGDYIFPGLIDTHSHIKYNVLPLWSQARGQFLNRFEWRDNFPPYKDATTLNMEPIKGDTECAAVRWAEVKAMTGGATALQGVGSDEKCASNWGVHNLEIPMEFRNPVAMQSYTDMIVPDLMGSVYIPMIQPLMDPGLDNYSTAYTQFLAQQGVTAWVSAFMTTTPTINGALQLLLGDGFTQTYTPDTGNGEFTADIETSASPTASDVRTALNQLAFASNANQTQSLTQILAGQPYNLSGQSASYQISAMSSWIAAYLATKGQAPTQASANKFLTMNGVMAIPSAVRHYISYFELPIREAALQYYGTAGAKAVIAHLAEGQRLDVYNRQEYDFAKMFGLAQSGLVVIHGVGMSAADFQDAASKNISIVWSPFSNLLLYGETLDVAAAKAAGINIALGSDWSPTGSKNILDELKIAHRYLTKMSIPITDKDLVDMVTVNAARALKLSDVVGQVAVNFQADLILVKKKTEDPYGDLVASTQADLDLSVIGGQAVYGEVPYITTAAAAYNDPHPFETLPLQANAACQFQKAIRVPLFTAYDQALLQQHPNIDLSRVAGIQAQLQTQLSSYAQTVSAQNPDKVAALTPLDPIFDCESPDYQSRFNAFIETELDANAQQRAALRASENLSDSFNPLTSGTAASDSGD